MNKKFLPFLFLAVLLTVLVVDACRKADSDDDVVDMTGEYIPLQIGKYIVYNVDSTIWEENTCLKLTRKYQFMYMVADTFRDAQNRLSYRIDTRIRKKTDEPWVDHDVIYVTKNKTNLEWAQSNLRFIKMIFPIKAFETWKGNAYVQSPDTPYAYFDNWDYQYRDVDQPFNVGEITYNKTVTILQRDVAENDPETLPQLPASRTYGKEVFAEGLGLVYREYYHWTYNPESAPNTDSFHTERCRLGTGVVMRAVDHN